jgi:hypothetical protein
MKKRFVVFAAALATAAIAVTPAFADGSVDWTPGQGTYAACGAGETPGLHWVFTPGGNDSVTAATLTVNGSEVISMTQSGGGSWSADSSGASEPTSATVAFTGDLGNGNANLVISHGCFSSGGTTGETTGVTTGETSGQTTGETSGETSSGGPTSGGPTSGGPTSGGGGTTGTGGVSGSTTGGTTGGTAATPSGGDLPFTGLPVWMPLLAAAAMVASGILMIRRRKGEVS